MGNAVAVKKQLNNKFSVVLPEYFGKDNSSRFQSEGKRFTGSKILTAALLHTRETVLGNGCTTSYTDFENELGFSRATIARNVKELTFEGVFKREGQSKYSSAYSSDNKHGVPVYHFLRTETFNGKRLSSNAVLYLSILIRFYTNQERKQKYFVGGQMRVAKVLTTADSTAKGIVDELLYAGVVRRFQMHDNKLSEGKGINGDYVTVYIVDDKILKRVKEIRKALNKKKSDAEALRKLFSEKTEPKRTVSDNSNKQSPYRCSIIERMPSAELTEMLAKENNAASIAKAFKNDFAFNQIKRNYINATEKYFMALKQSGGEDTSELIEIQDKLDSILSDVLNYLLSHNVQRTYIPEDWKTFIQEILRS